MYVYIERYWPGFSKLSISTWSCFISLLITCFLWPHILAGRRRLMLQNFLLSSEVGTGWYYEAVLGRRCDEIKPEHGLLQINLVTVLLAELNTNIIYRDNIIDILCQQHARRCQTAGWQTSHRLSIPVVLLRKWHARLGARPKCLHLNI